MPKLRAWLTHARYSSSALPLPVLVGLFYRVAVMYAASRIILALKKQNEGYEDTRKLSEEEPVSISVLPDLASE